MQASPMRRRRLRAWGLLAGALLLALAALASLALGSPGGHTGRPASRRSAR